MDNLVSNFQFLPNLVPKINVTNSVHKLLQFDQYGTQPFQFDQYGTQLLQFNQYGTQLL